MVFYYKWNGANPDRSGNHLDAHPHWNSFVTDRYSAVNALLTQRAKAYFKISGEDTPSKKGSQ